jgi:hypothetical protein
MKNFILALSIILATGCAATNINNAENQARMYMAEERPKALSGTIKWTAYYQGFINLANSFPDSTPGKYNLIAEMTEGLNMARGYEAGRISKDEFFKWREAGNAAAAARASQAAKTRAQCEYEAKSASASVQATGRSGINFDQLFKERELFELCMKSKQ